MRPRIPYFNFYPSDFIKGVRGLTPQEVGIYTMLLCRIYEENGPIDLHTGRLAAYCGCTEKVVAKVIDRLVYLGRINLVDGKLSDDRADAEIVKRENALKSQSRAGEISAQKRKQNQWASATGVQRDVNHTDTDTDKKDREINLSCAKPPKATRFDDFWTAYPHRGGVKRGRKPSEAKYIAALRSGVTEDALIEAAKRYAGDRRVIEGYARDPTTWLNQAGWTDEIDTTPFKAIKGGKHEQPSRSASTLTAFIGGAAGAS